MLISLGVWDAWGTLDERLDSNGSPVFHLKIRDKVDSPVFLTSSNLTLLKAFSCYRSSRVWSLMGMGRKSYGIIVRMSVHVTLI